MAAEILGHSHHTPPKKLAWLQCARPCTLCVFWKKKQLRCAQHFAHPRQSTTVYAPKTSWFTLYPYQFTVQWLKALRHGTCVRYEV